MTQALYAVNTMYLILYYTLRHQIASSLPVKFFKEVDGPVGADVVVSADKNYI